MLLVFLLLTLLRDFCRLSTKGSFSYRKWLLPIVNNEIPLLLSDWNTTMTSINIMQLLFDKRKPCNEKTGFIFLHGNCILAFSSYKKPLFRKLNPSHLEASELVMYMYSHILSNDGYILTCSGQRPVQFSVQSDK